MKEICKRNVFKVALSGIVCSIITYFSFGMFFPIAIAIMCIIQEKIKIDIMKPYISRLPHLWFGVIVIGLVLPLGITTYLNASPPRWADDGILIPDEIIPAVLLGFKMGSTIGIILGVTVGVIQWLSVKKLVTPEIGVLKWSLLTAFSWSISFSIPLATFLARWSGVNFGHIEL